jgi:hypothetical protein
MIKFEHAFFSKHLFWVQSILESNTIHKKTQVILVHINTGSFNARNI